VGRARSGGERCPFRDPRGLFAFFALVLKKKRSGTTASPITSSLETEALFRNRALPPPKGKKKKKRRNVLDASAGQDVREKE